MKIIKSLGSTKKTLMAIAGEMLNIESSQYLFEDGELCSNPVNGYPMFVHEHYKDVIRGASGCLFVGDIHDEIFRTTLKQCINELEKKLCKVHLGDYHTVGGIFKTVGSNYNTNVRFFPDTMNEKRDIVFGAGRSKNTRFHWTIMPFIDAADHAAHTSVENHITYSILSVLVDTDDLCKLPHNEVTYDFGIKDMRGFDRLTMESIMLCTHGHPLLIEFNKAWKERLWNCQEPNILNIDPAKLFGADRTQLRFKPTRLNETEESVNACSNCTSPLIGPCYGLAGHVDQLDSDIVVPICPLCLHYETKKRRKDANYNWVIRFEAEKSIEDFLANPTFTPERVKILREAMKSVEFKDVGSFGPRRADIGDNYVALMHTDRFLFTKMCLDPAFAGKKICKLV